jgi:hypothetical protein
VKRSKLLSAIGLFYLAIGVLGLIGMAEAISRDGLYLAQAVFAVTIQFGLAVGLFLQKSWVLKLFVASVVVLAVLNWIWLRSNPPEGMFWGTMWLIAQVLNIFPGVLMFLRRDQLGSSLDPKMRGANNA